LECLYSFDIYFFEVFKSFFKYYFRIKLKCEVNSPLKIILSAWSQALNQDPRQAGRLKGSGIRFHVGGLMWSNCQPEVCIPPSYDLAESEIKDDLQLPRLFCQLFRSRQQLNSFTRNSALFFNQRSSEPSSW